MLWGIVRLTVSTPVLTFIWLPLRSVITPALLVVPLASIVTPVVGLKRYPEPSIAWYHPVPRSPTVCFDPSPAVTSYFVNSTGLPDWSVQLETACGTSAAPAKEWVCVMKTPLTFDLTVLVHLLMLPL